MLLRTALATSLATSLATAVLPALLAGPASAETWTHRDRAGDVVSFTGSGDEEVVRPAPANTTTDVTRVVVDHTTELVRITLHVRDVRRGNQFAIVNLRHAGVDRAFATLLRDGGTTSFEVIPYSGDRCRGATGEILPRRDRVVMTVPRSCVGDPDWVRVSALYATFRGPFDTAEEGFGDDALRTGDAEQVRTTWSDRVRSS